MTPVRQPLFHPHTYTHTFRQWLSSCLSLSKVRCIFSSIDGLCSHSVCLSWGRLSLAVTRLTDTWRDRWRWRNHWILSQSPRWGNFLHASSNLSHSLTTSASEVDNVSESEQPRNAFQSSLFLSHCFFFLLCITGECCNGRIWNQSKAIPAFWMGLKGL